ncbi:MAG: hypothetical protein JRJ39_00400 [Deltaproteobacteria bacterium]|nr:hypothetical protein [Deltaproteobacteria bacterium]MBW1845568.1 hypothetical protein [Deltaproteobacteria bacterium]MBW2031998.1 hypothetical protein [Deltaproteobacteria bacterium]
MRKQTINMIAVLGILLYMLIWVYLLNVQLGRELKEIQNLKDSVNHTLLTFNVRKADLFLEVWENRRDIYVNRNEIAKVRTVMITSEYHIAMVPILVPGKSIVPKAVVNRLKPQKRGINE